jgi:hypothetical protein
MRRQYHPQKTTRGVLIWDVHRLIELTQKLPIRLIPIEAIRELDEPFWFDRPPSCREIANHAKLIVETDLAHPIILGADGRVMDGMHRVCKALMLGKKEISAVQFDRDPEPDHVDVPLEDLPYDEPW